MAVLATGAVGGARRGINPRLATPGAILLLAGVVLIWWGAGIFRGETSGGIRRRIGDPPKSTMTPEELAAWVAESTEAQIDPPRQGGGMYRLT